MEAKTAIELWNDGVEGRLNLQLYRCDVDSLLQEPQAGKTSPGISSRFYSASYEQESFDDNLADVWMPGFLDLDSSDEEEGSEDVNLEGRVTPPLRLFDHVDSPTYEELLKQNWELFDGSDQEPECSTLKDELELLASPEGALKCCRLIDHPVISVVPEPACATEATEMNPPFKRGPKKRKKNNWGRQKRRPPRPTAAMMVSVDDEIESKVEDPGGLAGYKGFQDCCQPNQTVAESGSSVLEQGLPWESLLGTPTSPAPPIPASELFAEHLKRCAVDWDYPTALFSIGGYEPEPIPRKRVPSQTRATFARPGPAPLALEHKSTPALGVFSRKKPNLSSDSEGLQIPGVSAGFNMGLENVEPTPNSVRPNKRRRVVT